MKRSGRLRATTQTLLACSALALAGCGGDHTTTSAQMAEVTVTATAIPSDGRCTHIVVTRLADFQSTEYRGLLSGATIQAPLGEDRVTATAYPTPCGSEPATAPWVADPQTVTLVSGPNTVTLNFHQNVGVAIDPNFDDTSPLVVRAGSEVRIARNGEDTTGPNFAIDAWELKQLTLPPAAVSETVVFSLENKGMPYSPRGVARLPDGSFIFQVAEVRAPLYLFSATGAPLGTWAVSYPAGAAQWENTDGIEAIDATHLVRTAWANRPFGCDAAGEHCKQAGLEILEKQTAADGTVTAAVTRQIFLPELPAASLNAEYPVGVAPVGARFAVTTLPDSGGTRLTLLNADGTLAAGPTDLAANDIEGLFDDGAGRLVGLDYDGTLSTYNDSDLTVRAGETGSLAEGVGLATPFRLAWRSAGAGGYIAYENQRRLVFAAPDFSSITDAGIDLSSFPSIVGLDYRADTDSVLLMDRFTSPPTVATINLATKMQTGSVVLQPGVSVPVRPFGLAYVPSTSQLVAHYRRTSGADASLDAVAFVHNADGSLASKLDLAPLGFVRINSVRYRGDTDELLFLAVDGSGITRIVTTDRAGKPHRSYRVDAFAGMADLALITSGPSAGDFGAVESQPSWFARIFLP